MQNGWDLEWLLGRGRECLNLFWRNPPLTFIASPSLGDGVLAYPKQSGLNIFSAYDEGYPWISHSDFAMRCIYNPDNWTHSSASSASTFHIGHHHEPAPAWPYLGPHLHTTIPTPSLHPHSKTTHPNVNQSHQRPDDTNKHPQQRPQHQTQRRPASPTCRARG